MSLLAQMPSHCADCYDASVPSLSHTPLWRSQESLVQLQLWGLQVLSCEVPVALACGLGCPLWKRGLDKDTFVLLTSSVFAPWFLSPPSLDTPA